MVLDKLGICTHTHTRARAARSWCGSCIDDTHTHTQMGIYGARANNRDYKSFLLVGQYMDYETAHNENWLFANFLTKHNIDLLTEMPAQNAPL